MNLRVDITLTDDDVRRFAHVMLTRGYMLDDLTITSSRWHLLKRLREVVCIHGVPLDDPDTWHADVDTLTARLLGR